MVRRSSISTLVATSTPLLTVPSTSTRAPSTMPAVPSGKLAWLASTARPLTSKLAAEVKTVITPSTWASRCVASGRRRPPRSAVATQAPSTCAVCSSTRTIWPLARLGGTLAAGRPA